ncbi:MAG: sirohydrochlorin chelatase [SAR324 cluster bacterium]|jgi:sirohydrochlorin cobaltochelatase|nr:sirohydrochlorin chelatase [SAR324 cluster bacterium]MDP6521638.1 sirohydrochlorin chelatase [SAR324 cluster bacterium]
MEERFGVMVCGHGSRDEEAVIEFLNFAKKLKKKLLQYELDWGFLEFATPVIKRGLDSLREKGIREIMSIPVMLFAAGHAKNDIPSVLNAYQAQFPELSISYGRELGIDLKLIRAAGERVKEAIEQADGNISPEETLLMVVGRGSSDPDANSNVSKVTRMLWEGLGLGWAETAYSGVTFPLIKPGLEHACRLGFKRIVVFPYFLFTGILVKRIYQYTDLVAAEHPEIQFVKSFYLNDHPLVLDTFSERVEEIRNGVNNMNCKLCKYREQFLGFENEVGLRQESHHHHVEGIGTGHSHSHGHSHDHDHTHDHGHHPYPHADHPLGPKTLEQESSQGNH